MKIAFFSSFPPENDGIAKYSKRLIDHFPIDVEIAVFTKREKSISEEAGVFRMLSCRVGDIVKTYKQLLRFNPDIIHVQYVIPLWGLYSIILWSIVLAVKISTGAKIVITFHEVKREINLLRAVGRCYFYILSLFADAISVHTNEAREILMKNCRVTSKKVHVIPHGTFSFSSKKMSSVRQQFKIAKPKVVLFLGYIHIDKGIEYLLDAFARLDKSLRDETQLLIVGSVRPRNGIFRLFGRLDFKYYEMIKKKIKMLGISEDTTLIDYIPDDLIYSFLKMSSCIVLPYTNGEQSGILNLAISAQTPVVASNIGGIGETLRYTGVLVEPGDSSALSFEIEKILRDDKYAENLSRSYSHLNEELHPEKIILQILGLYRKLL